MTNRSSACLVSPNRADAELARRLLEESGIAMRTFSTLSELARSLDENAGCLILVEESLVDAELPVLRAALESLPAWCDLPLVAVSGNVMGVGQVVADAFPNSGNVTLLERPLNPHTLTSSVHLASRTNTRQREVGELLAQREQAVKLRDEFLAMLAHELRNPLAPIRNATHILRRFNTDPSMLERNLEIMDRQVDHLVRMIDDLLDVARLERGKLAIRKTALDLNDVVRASIESCPVKERALEIHLAAEQLPFCGDAVRVEQIVCNLLNNAAKFTGPAARIRVSTRRDGETAILSVEDNGIGFSPDVASRLFEPFMQLNTTLDRTSGGLGLGLAIAHRLTMLHGGEIRASSDGPGRGARFTVILPMREAGMPERARPQEPPAGGQARRVVAIEDNPDVRETLRQLVSLWGHAVSAAGDGVSGLKLILQDRPDVALIDVGLPGLNGYEVAREIRKVIPREDIRLVAITGYGQPADRQKAVEAGFDDHLLKPILPEVLEQLLRA